MSDKILLVDTDSKVPNLALMKVSAYHKARGDKVTLYRLGRSAYKNARKDYIGARNFNMTYVSTLFKINKDRVIILDCRAKFGGSGHDIKTSLPAEIEILDPDYSIYPGNVFSYGYITRGCNRKCR